MHLTSDARYNQWVRDHYRFLMRSAWALTGSRSVAEDVVQDCFANAWRCKDQLRDMSLARPWLFKIMRRSVLAQVVPHTQSMDDDEATDEKAAPDSGIDDRLDVVKALGKLAPIHREVLVLYYFDDMPTAQIAEALEIAAGTVLSRLARAREALKGALTTTRPLMKPESVANNVTAIRRI